MILRVINGCRDFVESIATLEDGSLHIKIKMELGVEMSAEFNKVLATIGDDLDTFNFVHDGLRVKLTDDKADKDNAKMFELLKAVNEKIRHTKADWMREHNEVVEDRFSMLKNLQLSIKQSLGIAVIDGKAELEKVVSDDMELNEKDERTTGMATVYVSKMGHTAKWFFYFNPQSSILNLEHAIFEKTGIEFGVDTPFRLQRPLGGSYYEKWEPLEASLPDDKSVILAVVLVGGGKDVKKAEMKHAFIKQQKKIASENLLQSTRAKSGYVKAEAINMFPQYHELTGMVDDMVAKASISGSQGLEAVIAGCSSIESLQEALQILDTKVARTNSIDHRVRLCGKHLMGEPMKSAVETQKSMETIIDVAQTAFLHVFMKCGAEITGFDVSNLKVMLSNRISFLEGQQAQSSGDADALAAGLGGMNIS